MQVNIRQVILVINFLSAYSESKFVTIYMFSESKFVIDFTKLVGILHVI